MDINFFKLMLLIFSNPARSQSGLKSTPPSKKKSLYSWVSKFISKCPGELLLTRITDCSALEENFPGTE